MMSSLSAWMTHASMIRRSLPTITTTKRRIRQLTQSQTNTIGMHRCSHYQMLSTATTTTANGNRRVPLPPMPRVLASSSSAASQKSHLRQWWDNGNILLFLGWSGLAVMALDRYLLYQMQIEIDSNEMLETVTKESQRERETLLKTWKDAPTLFNCMVLREYKNMGGSHGLAGLQVGDVVQVLQEGVGPDQLYHLCRIDGSGRPIDNTITEPPLQIGWYPIAFMKRLEDEPKRKSFWNSLGFGRRS